MTSFFHYRELLRNLVIKDLKIKYRDSAIGFLWSLINPLLLILVYSFVFSHILRVDIANFSYFLLVGILPWTFFAQSLMMSTGSIIDNGGLIRKVAMPMEIFPVATVLFNLAQFGLAFLVFLPMTIFFFDVRIGWVSLWFLPLLLLHLLFTVGLSFLVATATVFYRDVRHLMETLLMLLFWLTPLGNLVSRKHEYEADAFARNAMKGAAPLIGALRKLAEKNLSNLTPHPIYSGFYYSHPTLLEREQALTNAHKPQDDRK